MTTDMTSTSVSSPSVNETSLPIETPSSSDTEHVQQTENEKHTPVKNSNLDYIQSLPLKEIDRILQVRKNELETMVQLARIKEHDRKRDRFVFHELLNLKRWYLNQREFVRCLNAQNRMFYRKEQERLTKNSEVGAVYVKYLAAIRERNALQYYLQTEVIPIEKERKITKRIDDLTNETEQCQITLNKYGYFEMIEQSLVSKKNRYYHTTLKEVENVCRALFKRIQEFRTQKNSANTSSVVLRELEAVKEEYRILEERKNSLLWNTLASSGTKEPPTRKHRANTRPRLELTSEQILERLIKGEEYNF